MTLQGITVCVCFSAAVLARGVRGSEQNDWPGPVTRTDAAGHVESRDTLGPLIFQEPSPEGGRVAGFRPFCIRRANSKGELEETTVLYPLFYYRSYGDMYEWSFFKLINRFGKKEGTPPGGDTRTFDVWPFYFSRDTGDPATSTRGFLPIAGTAEGHFGYERISWMLFPLYVKTQLHGATSTFAPWPIIRVTRGSEQGFAVWPLVGRMEKPGVSKTEYFLWPLAWNNTVESTPDSAPGTAPDRQFGILPFFSIERSPARVNETYLWPFFGYTDRTSPDRYHETRYFWPFLVQGRGDSVRIDRWGPFYTHSVVKGLDKTWVVWPLVRRMRWVDGIIAQERNQFLYFLYWNQEQRDLRRPQAPPAQKTCLWPIVSTWDNGAGRRQIEVLSPFEGLLADNPRVREAWSPLFALWRYDQRAPGETRTSLFWNAATWAKSASAGRSEFHLGPLIAVERTPASKRVAIGGGVLGFEHRADGRGWRLFCLEFGRAPRNLYAASAQ
jgi:hypothetical protein